MKIKGSTQGGRYTLFDCPTCKDKSAAVGMLHLPDGRGMWCPSCDGMGQFPIPNALIQRTMMQTRKLVKEVVK